MAPGPRRGDGGPTILLVEDDRLLRKAAESALRLRGFRVVAVPNGDEALRAVAAEPPDLILLDLVMPGLQGHQVLKVLKDDAATARIPVVILTNLGQDSDVQQALNAGAAAYAIKTNLGLEDLVALVRRTLLMPESPRDT
ncbi:MAG TPA: response regulator [bacterium]|nr:response regulator [bacterium]